MRAFLHSLRLSSATGPRGLAAWVVVAGLLAAPLTAQTLFWDTNAKNAGAGGTEPAGTWTTSNSNKNWTSTAAGTSNSTQAWNSGADAVFSAGSDATGAYTVTVSGTQNVSSIQVDDGSPTLSSGTINFGDASPDIRVAAGRTLTFGNALTSTSNNLNLGGASFTGTTIFAADTSLSGSVNLAGGTLQLSGSNYTFGSLNVTGNSTIDFAGATTLTLTNLTISAGVVLTIQNWSAATDNFFTANWTGAVKDTMGSAPMNRIQFTGFTASESGWDSYDNQIRPNVPEPATYGAAMLGLLVVSFAWRRWRRRAAPAS